MNLNESMSAEEEVQSQDTDLRALIEQKNIAETLDDEKLDKIGKLCAEGFERDMESRKEWEVDLEEWQKLALQVKEEKSWPWTGASNVKYPLLSIASMQFNARAYPSLVPSAADIVRCEVIGKDPTGEKLERAKRVGTFMSYQVMNQMAGWEEGMDKLLIMLPVIGCMFKKTYYNPITKQNVSDIVLPKNLVVDYWAKSLEDAERVSECLQINRRVMKERQMSGTYLEVDLGDPQIAALEPGKPVPVAQDETTPYSIIEMHTYYDLDDDGYAEPYIVTFERFTGKVLRIVARFDDESILLNAKGELAQIKPIHYYTKFGFIPNPEGGFYDIGFGRLLSPLNESVNTLINQLIDAGTLANLQGGFLGKGLKLKMGESRWTPGEWKSVTSTAEDLRKQIVPLPAKEPSDVLFKLMGTLITGAKELASVAEIMTGKMPGQNTPATTTMATIEQGMKVFTAVYKRVYRALKEEFKKIYALNATYLDDAQYSNIVDAQIGPADFDSESYDICPGADPNTATQTEKLMKAQGLMELVQLGTLDIVEVTRRILEAQEQPNADKLLNQAIQQTGQMPPPPPDPKVMALQEKAKADAQKGALDRQQAEFNAMLSQREQEFQMQMEKQKAAQDAQLEMMKARAGAIAKLETTKAQMASAQASHEQKMAMNQQNHQQALTHKEESAKLQRQQVKSSTKTGKPTPSQKR